MARVKTHYYIYLGKERGEHDIYKVGRTTQTCWARCKNSDYRIGLGIEIHLPPSELSWHKFCCLEDIIIGAFYRNFPKAHGNEYFKIAHDWEYVQTFFLNEIIPVIKTLNCKYTIHQGWVEPNTY